MRSADKVNWPGFLGRHDMVFDSLPSSWEEAPYFGNGNIGSMVYQTEPDVVRLQVFRSDVHDHRDNTHGWTAYSRPRFMLGWFELCTTGDITGCDLRMDLWNAELSGTISTRDGDLRIRHFVHSVDMALVFEVQTTSERASWKWRFVPGEARTTRPGYPESNDDIKAFAERYGEHYRDTLESWVPNPPVRLVERNGVLSAIQDLEYEGQYCVAWAEKNGTLFCAIENTYPDSEASKLAYEGVLRVSSRPMLEWRNGHRDWWHSYYPISFVSLPDTRLERFYWHQIYKLACATRADRPMMDTSGPWIQSTPWPYITWDLNVQLCYWPVCASGRFELGMSLINTLYDNRQALIENVRPVEWQDDSALLPICTAQDLREPRNGDMRYFDAVGDLTWALHNCWLIYRHCIDDDLLRKKIYPLLRRSINLYFHLSREDGDGSIHLVPTYSPEYNQGPNTANPDCNFDLALFRWGCHTLIEICDRLSIEDPLAPKWHEVVDRLTEYPRDEYGLSIARDVPLAYSHRHYSHLLMIYPLYLLNRDQEGARELIERSLKHWISFDGALMGYSYTGASSIAASMGEGDEALKYLRGLYPFLLPNGMYKEAGPVMETPLSGAQCIHDMLIQSWGGKVRIFPAVPSEWRDVTYHDLRAEGAFDVSAERKDGRTMWVSVTSLTGEPLTIIPDLGRNVTVCRDSGETTVLAKDGTLELDLARSETVRLSHAQ